jgi:hypothetical protein
LPAVGPQLIATRLMSATGRQLTFSRCAISSPARLAPLLSGGQASLFNGGLSIRPTLKPFIQAARKLACILASKGFLPFQQCPLRPQCLPNSNADCSIASKMAGSDTVTGRSRLEDRASLTSLQNTSYAGQPRGSDPCVAAVAEALT